MEARRYNSLTHKVHTEWLGRAINMNLGTNPNKGPDLESKDKTMITEVKMHLGLETKPSWTVDAKQLEYANGRRFGFWALGVYHLENSTNVREITLEQINNIDRKVRFRQIYIMPWAWIYQFSLRKSKGKTKNSEWDTLLAYPKIEYIPKVTDNVEVNGGIIYFTERTSPRMFGLS